MGLATSRRGRSRLLPRTVRGRSAAAAALAMALVLAAGGGWLYVILRANLLDNANGRTELAAREVAARADAGPLPSLLPAPRSGVDVVLVLDPRGTVVATSRPSAGPLAREFAALRPQPGQDAASKVLCCSRAMNGERGDVVVVRATPAPGEERYVYALTVLNDVDDATHAIALGLLGGAPPLIALAAAIAWAVTGLALRPVTAIRTELAAVTASELDRRVPDPAGGDEVAALARTVNATLDRLEQAVARQRQFVADASHELRNPVAAVRSQLEVALAAAARPDHRTGHGTACRTGCPTDCRTDCPTSGAVRAALADTVRLQHVAADLLLLARLDARVPTGTGEPVDLALLAAEEAARRPSTRVPLTVTAVAPVPMRGRSGQLERLVANLVDNALRHAASRVEVSAFLDETAGQAVLEVADDGPGIAADQRERVFERFVRLDAARDRESGGSGLGLAIAREIAHAHGGSLVVAPGGGGARLVARFPLPDGQPGKPGTRPGAL
ncbi:sensor histidine kinase [Streptomyces netropsis]|uniref:histidine kinase n=1 Tax=Streptomyces netropsis TaxID=55404 RepID=A0A7W7L9W8_STRNE|nr:HAMP domain-containing sensor histidine kinase [Streptomyces netropsis]MBB4886329.1 signal transduction histidine kinase [Streptomyces netropsis]GGR19344.1 two-component sensor histidine kinase [Streptomyces netropsis]